MALTSEYSCALKYTDGVVATTKCDLEICHHAFDPTYKGMAQHLRWSSRGIICVEIKDIQPRRIFHAAGAIREH